MSGAIILEWWIDVPGVGFTAPGASSGLETDVSEGDAASLQKAH